MEASWEARKNKMAGSGLSSRVASVSLVLSYAQLGNASLKPPNYRAAPGNTAKRKSEKRALLWRLLKP